MLVLGTVLLPADASAQATTIVARETGSWLLHEEGMESVNPQFEVTYVVTDSMITRTAVVDFRSGEVRQDNTIYTVLQGLLLHDMAVLESGVPESAATYFGPVIRAVGQPAPGAIEILVIGPTFVRSTRSSAGYFAITDLDRKR